MYLFPYGKRKNDCTPKSFIRKHPLFRIKVYASPVPIITLSLSYPNTHSSSETGHSFEMQSNSSLNSLCVC